MIPLDTRVMVVTPHSRRNGQEAVVFEHLPSRTVWGETLMLRFADGAEMSYSELEVEVLTQTKET